MAGRGPAPKPAAQRRRRNKTATAALIVAPARPALPALKVLAPSVGWLPLVEAWWADLAVSPMAGEYDATDMHGLLRLAMLNQQFWAAESETARLEAAREIRLLAAEYGLSPRSRRSLQWEIERAEQAVAKTAARKAAAPKKRVDPRLKA